MHRFQDRLAVSAGYSVTPPRLPGCINQFNKRFYCLQSLQATRDQGGNLPEIFNYTEALRYAVHSTKQSLYMRLGDPIHPPIEPPAGRPRKLDIFHVNKRTNRVSSSILPLALLGRQLAGGFQVLVNEVLLYGREARLIPAVVHGVLAFTLQNNTEASFLNSVREGSRGGFDSGGEGG